MTRGGVLCLLLAASCAAGGKLRSTQDVLRQDIEKARKSGAEKCAPKELALAEAYTDFAGNDIDLGQAGPAEEKLKVAEQNVKRALELSKDCGQKQVTVRPAPEPVPIIIEKVERDSDGDGIPDDIDKCPLEPEDKDGFQDEDGCPDPDNDNDGIVGRDGQLPEQARARREPRLPRAGPRRRRHPRQRGQVPRPARRPARRAARGGTRSSRS